MSKYIEVEITKQLKEKHPEWNRQRVRRVVRALIKKNGW